MGIGRPAPRLGRQRDMRAVARDQRDLVNRQVMPVQRDGLRGGILRCGNKGVCGLGPVSRFRAKVD
eukprot:gene1728-1759_t